MGVKRMSGAVVGTGNAYATGYEASSAGVITGALISFPVIRSSSYKDVTDIPKEADEGGNQYAQEGTRDVTWTMTHMQKDKQSMDMMVSTYRGKYMSIVKQISKNTITHFDGSAYHTYRLAPLCKPQPNLTEEPGIETEIVFDVEACLADIVMALGSFDDGSFDSTLSGNITIPKGEYSLLITVAAKS